MLGHFGWRAVIAVVVSTLGYFFAFRQEFPGWPCARRRQTSIGPRITQDARTALLPVPCWLTAVHIAFMVWTVLTAHYPALFIGGFFIFLGFTQATTAYQSRIDLKPPLLVGFFLAGLVIHGGLQGWWIAPVLASLSETPLFSARRS